MKKCPWCAEDVQDAVVIVGLIGAILGIVNTARRMG